MKTRDIEVDSPVLGRKSKAKLAVCAGCDCDLFLIFSIEGQDHPHFQCYLCGVSYCPDGKCQAAEVQKGKDPT